MNFKIVMMIAVLALIGAAAFVSADEAKPAESGSSSLGRNRDMVSRVTSCPGVHEAKVCKECCAGKGLQFQQRKMCVCSRFFNTNSP